VSNNRTIVHIRKHRLTPTTGANVPSRAGEIDLGANATVLFSSEAPEHPVERMLDGQIGPGGTYWAADSADVTEEILLEFDKPLHIARLCYQVEERQLERTQEVLMEYSCDGGGSYRSGFVQEYTFSPAGATFQSEDLKVELHGVTHLRLRIKPNKNGSGTATLTSLRLFGPVDAPVYP
jgi:hypothetical protein